MSLLDSVVATLRTAGVHFTVIGGIALAARGVSRSTLDIDLLAVDRRCLDRQFWKPVELAGAAVEIRQGDIEDPLAGVVRIREAGGRPVDVVVGKFTWQADAIGRGEPLVVLGTIVPVARSADLVLLKLFAGGPQDAWDISQLLSADAEGSLAGAVEAALPDLPRHARELWLRIRSS